MNCSIQGCERTALIPINRLAKGNPPMKLCQNHYFKLLRALTRRNGEQSGIIPAAIIPAVHNEVDGLTNLEIEALVSGNEFKQIIAKAIADSEQSKG